MISTFPPWLADIRALDGPARTHWSPACERLINRLAAAAALVLLSPLLVLIACVIGCDSPGPILYRQTRVGRRGRRFAMVKFRSMHPGAEDGSGPVWTTDGDPRITGAGAWLRRLHLDELPQLWNVLAGDMNLIGPRPERPLFVEQFRTTIPLYELRHQVRPGITGWAQVRRGYAASIADARAKHALDLFYLQNHSLGLDWVILLQTAKIVLLGRDARKGCC